MTEVSTFYRHSKPARSWRQSGGFKILHSELSLMKNTISILLIVGILVIVNLLSRQFFYRLDLTENKEYTLSQATKDIIQNLEDPVTVTAYFSEDIPQQLVQIKEDFQEMLVEYSTLSKGMIDYEFIDPSGNTEKEQEAAQNGIQPLMVQVREKDQSKQQRAYLGAVIRMGEQKEIIPVLASGSGMEYTLSTSIKKLSVVEKPSIGLVQGHGEPALSDLEQAYQQLSILYNVQNVDLNNPIPEHFKAVAIIAPKDSIPPLHFANLDNYYNQGGKIFAAINRVHGDLQTAQGSSLTTGMESWLSSKGVEVEGSFLIDASCGSVTVQQRQGPFMMNTPVSFPFLPMVSAFTEHPITKGMEQLIFPFASPVKFLGDSTAIFTPILTSSERSGIVSVPTFFDVQKKWTATDLPLSKINIGGVLERPNTGSKLVVIGDGDFPMQGRGQNSDNVSLLVNGIDWLSDDTGLIALRTKGVSSRPIKTEYLGDENASTRNFWKYFNFGFPLLLVAIYGIVRSTMQRRKRMQRMQENYA